MQVENGRDSRITVETLSVETLCSNNRTMCSFKKHQAIERDGDRFYIKVS